MKHIILLGLFSLTLFSCKTASESKKIDRHALVTRHNITLSDADTMASLSVGNGEFAFTADVSGLQSFPAEYDNGIALGTQTQWAWHSVSNEGSFILDDVAKPYESCDGTSAPYAIQHKEGRAKEATDYLRANPHRLHLGLTGLVLQKEDGTPVGLSDLKQIKQTLDLWTGELKTSYEIEGVPVSVTLFSHYDQDGISARIESPLIEKQRLRISFRFPYGKECHVCPGYDWGNEDKHTSTLSGASSTAVIERKLDSTSYFANIAWTAATIEEVKPHHFELTPAATSSSISFSIIYTPQKSENKIPDFEQTKSSSVEGWKKYWSTGGAIDFSECTDPRAKELERRVVLSQYLTRIQCAGSLPPQETGLTMNSWYGKFHLEMHWWHAAHFGLWDRHEHFEKSMTWYNQVLPKAKHTATWQGYRGARWQKMTEPAGNESPSGVGAFIIWQQPHPIYLAELLFRKNGDTAVLARYRDVVFNTAEFMASFVKQKDSIYHLCHPLIPAQEIFKAVETDDPAFELQYWYYALNVAQQWRERLGMERDPEWQRILNTLAPLPVKDGLYLPTATTPAAYTDTVYRRDHPAVLGAYGILPWNHRLDSSIMKKTFDVIEQQWQWPTTWGWDYPMMAMTAARLHKPESAVNALLLDVQKNRYLVNGHNYQDQRLRLYLPGNGGLLAAVAMMAAGWDGSDEVNPGFPKDGTWNVRWEGLKKMP